MQSSENKLLIEWCVSVGVSREHALLLADHIDVSQCRVAGSLWRFAGLEAPEKHGVGFNRNLKQLCLEIGEGFARTEVGFGRLYKERVYATFRGSKRLRNIDHLHAHARRAVIKRFLAEYFEAAWWLRYGQLPPAAWPDDILNARMIPGLTEAKSVRVA